MIVTKSPSQGLISPNCTSVNPVGVLAFQVYVDDTSILLGKAAACGIFLQYGVALNLFLAGFHR